MTTLKERLRRLIAAAGPITVSDYMATCLFDPQAGYYTTREPFGAAGDFTTAPEVSQMFGELVAVRLYTAWRAAGSPLPATFAEIGPGRGTLMRDMLRTLGKLDPDFIASADVALIEASPRLAAIQKETLADGPGAPRWFRETGELAERPLIIVGNELFDALPMRQAVKTAHGWRERVVRLDDEGELEFAAGAAELDPAVLPSAAADAPTGAIFEYAPARTALMEEIAATIAARGGFGLFIDYGYTEPAIGDTLQAVRRHAFDDVLAHPGEADLTSHVDFSALAQAARDHGLRASIATQGDFLLRMGLLERAGALGASTDEAARERLRGEVERLAGPSEMGKLFKVMEVARVASGPSASTGAD
ncbi:class I SAM-dependent methyltransferase [Aquamicrobium sp. LC103]|uniref:class I SAM-dependent methyltransferase n=1 Tax=Aquamicrobium sp. LC103 TaxID=1120658 RepID=UPI00063EB366|nr:class I SAM-dependent methyltransferase [Aquamicrobium sp. LC103]TKT77327.1 class I SAM-dependent methyltransferase [Aquamicrobium sp. LC103]